MKKLNDEYKEPDFDDVLEEVLDDEFEIGPGLTERGDLPDKKIVCKKCGSDKWIVGVGDYHTAIKCPNCKYEMCIHSG